MSSFLRAGIELEISVFARDLRPFCLTKYLEWGILSDTRRGTAAEQVVDVSSRGSTVIPTFLVSWSVPFGRYPNVESVYSRHC